MDKDTRFSLSGLPPLPKSLSTAAHNNTLTVQSCGGSPLNSFQQTTSDKNDVKTGASTSAASLIKMQRGHRQGSLSTQESLSDRESVNSRNSIMSHSSHHTPTNNNPAYSENFPHYCESGVSISTLDTQLEILRREMYGLRQLDLSLLSQLWALNESIQGFRIFLQDQDLISPPSPSSGSDTNSLSFEEESFIVPNKTGIEQARQPQGVGISCNVSYTSNCSTSGTSRSSTGSSVDGHRPIPPPPMQRSHPQLPRILQQRMRHAPPPPPPTSRSKEPLPTPISSKKLDHINTPF